MQRKNNILKKDAMAMIMAIVVIVVISTIMAISLSMTTLTTKKMTDLYLYEQAMIYSKSVAELALLKIAKDGCQNSFNKNFDGIYDANVTMQYIYTEEEHNKTGGKCNEYISYIKTDEQNGSVLMDISVTSDAGSEPIRYFRRTIQKL
ncbi:MAG: hypothetical protein ABGW74_01490 [Campylobacterales bacterium]